MAVPRLPKGKEPSGLRRLEGVGKCMERDICFRQFSLQDSSRDVFVLRRDQRLRIGAGQAKSFREQRARQGAELLIAGGDTVQRQRPVFFRQRVDKAEDIERQQPGIAGKTEEIETLVKNR